jgi:DNA-directed RNA polymerase specialized sigma24 family protein
MTKDINDQIRQYENLVENLARQYSGSKAARRVNADVEDLRQEGRLAVWQALGQGVQPANTIILIRMKGWVRLLARQQGYNLTASSQPQHIPYEQMLPLDDFRAQGGE